MTSHTIVALMQDRPGVLHRTVTLLRRRGFNILSLAVGSSERAGMSRCTFVVDADDAAQVVRQLDRLVDVLGVADVSRSETIERETALVRLSTDATTAAEAIALARSFGAHVELHHIGASGHDIIVGITDAPARVDACVATLTPLGITECQRTGRLAMLRGPLPRVLESPTDYRAQADGAPTEEAA